MQKQVTRRHNGSAPRLSSFLMQPLESRVLFTGLSATFTDPETVGASLSADLSVTNVGSTPVSGSISADFYVSTTDDLSGTLTPLTTASVPVDLPAGRSTVKLERITIPSLSSGTYFIVCQLNLNGAVSTDNIPTTPFATGSFTISGGATSVPHLVFPQTLSNAVEGSTITPAVTVDIEDSSNSVITSDDSDVTLSVNSGTVTGTTTVAAVNGVATFSGVSLANTGSYMLIASDGTDTAGTSNSFQVVASGGTTTLTGTTLSLNASAAAITSGGSEILTATVTPALTIGSTPTGTVTFTLSDGTTLGTADLTAGTAVLTTAALPVGDDQISASYSGDSNFASSATTTAAAVDVTGAVPNGTLLPTITKSSLPASVVGGTKVHGNFSVTVTNSSADLSFTKDQVVIFASTTGIIDSSSTQIAIFTKKLKLKAAQSTKVPLSFKSLSLPVGSYTLLAQTTDSNGVVSTGSAGPALTVAAPFIDLSATVSAVKPITVVAGKSVSVIVTVTNTGNINSTGKMTVGVGLSSDGATLAIPLTTIKKSNVTVKAGGKAFPIHLSFRVPVGTTAGSYYPFLTITQGTTEFSVVGAVLFAVG